MPIKPLNTHYSFENPGSIYDEEAMTALELAGRTACKMDETVQAFNGLESQTNEHLEAQDNEIDEMIRQTNEHLESQDKAIEHVRTVTVPQDVQDECIRLIESGAFDLAISLYMNNLNERVNNLLGTLQEGSTTGDAELIDARTDHLGISHTNLGEHIRKATSRPSFLDSDIIKSRFQTVLPNTYKEQEYDGASAWISMSIGTFTLEKGNYVLIVPDTNTIQANLSNEKGERLVNSAPLGCHYFSITEGTGQTVSLFFNISTAQPSPAGLYYVHFYLFKVDGSEAVLPGYLLENDDLITLFNPSAKVFRNVAKNHNGTATYDHVKTPVFTLEAGLYHLFICDSDFISLTVVQVENTERLFNTSDNAGVNGHFTFTVDDDHANKETFIQLNCSLDTTNTPGLYRAKKLFLVKDNGQTLIPGAVTGFDALEDKISQNYADLNMKIRHGVNNGYLVASADALTTGNSLQIPDTVNVKNNKTLIFSGELTSFTGLRLGHGKTSYGGSYLEIDGSHIKVYSYETGATLLKTEVHGLTISRFLTVVIKAGIGTADITLFTASGMFTLKGVTWSGCNGLIFADALSSFTKPVLKWTTTDIEKPVWVFGDSYLGMTNPERYPFHLLEMGLVNFLACGYPGGSSADELASLKSLLTIGCPRVLVWCLGMNNGDTGAVNSSWLACVNEVKALCAENGIELILATIPNCPVVDNTYKNAIVRESGYRYVDFHKAVVVDGTTWVAGALASDNIHPSQLGAKILANRFIVDVPEITM